MKRILFILFLSLIIGTSNTYAESGWYNLSWQPGSREWLANYSQSLNWNGNGNYYLAHLGLGYNSQAVPPKEKTFNRNLVMVVTSEPELIDFKMTKIGEIDKYFRTYISFSADNTKKIDSTDPSDYFPITIPTGSNQWDSNISFKVKSNAQIFPNDFGFNGIYSTFYRFRLYPADHVKDDEYLLVDDTFLLSFKYNEAGQWESTALQAIRNDTEIDVVQLQQHNSPLTVGSVEFFSNVSNNYTYTLHIGPGEIGSQEFAFHKQGGGNSIPYRVSIVNSTLPSSSGDFEREVTTRDANNRWHDFFELAILGFNPNVSYDSGDYSSTIKISLTVDRGW